MKVSADEGQPGKAAIAGVFDRSAAEYDRIGDFFTPVGRDLVSATGVRTGESVLDVGCGRGAALFAAADAVGPSGRVIGIDLAEQMVALTAAEAAPLEQVSVLVGDAERPEFPDGRFDVILAALVLFLLPDPATALRRYAALLAPGGRLAFSTFGRPDANFEAAMRVLGSFVPGGLPPRPERQGPFGSPTTITALLADHGFAAPDISEQSYVTRFRDSDEWLSWVWSHGGRATLERVPAARLDEATSAAREAFEPARTDAGDYAMRTEIRFTVARPS
jgi:SAM-dependent methyltransferase